MMLVSCYIHHLDDVIEDFTQNQIVGPWAAENTLETEVTQRAPSPKPSPRGFKTK